MDGDREGQEPNDPYTLHLAVSTDFSLSLMELLV